MTGEKGRAPEHRGETERWTLDAPRKGKKDAPRLCFAGENCRTIELNGDVFEHVEVVPSAALAAERERADRIESGYRTAMERRTVESRAALEAQTVAADKAIEAARLLGDRAEEYRKIADVMRENVERTDKRAEEAQKEVERLRADNGALKAQVRNVIQCLRRCATELEYVQAVEGGGHDLCATGEGKAAAQEAWDVIAENRV